MSERTKGWLTNTAIAIIGIACIVYIAVMMSRIPSESIAPSSRPPPRSTGDQIDVRVEAEFRYRGQDCIIVSVYDQQHSCNEGNDCSWRLLERFHDCNHGLTPSVPRPNNMDGGIFNDNWWDSEYGMK